MCDVATLSPLTTRRLREPREGVATYQWLGGRHSARRLLTAAQVCCQACV
jgi:hypothetical protein